MLLHVKMVLRGLHSDGTVWGLRNNLHYLCDVLGWQRKWLDENLYECPSFGHLLWDESGPTVLFSQAMLEEKVVAISR